MKIDKTDLKIIDALKENAKYTTSTISKKYNVPITTVHNRIKKLEKEGVIKSYAPVLDHHKLGKFIYALALVRVNFEIETGEEFMKKIKNIPGTEEICSITGMNDFIVRVRVESIKALNNYLMQGLRKIKGVVDTQTHVVMNFL